MKCSATALFKTVFSLFYTTTKFFFITLQRWSSRHFIQFLNLVSKHSPPLQCYDPSVIKRVRWDSILAWMKYSATALFKTALHFFIQLPPNCFYCTSKLVKRHVIQFLNLVSSKVRFSRVRLQ